MKEQSTYVFCRPEYTGEEDYIEPKKYTCCNCGERMEKADLVQHATICIDPYTKTSKAIEKFENKCKEIDYTKLRPGIKVKLKSWDWSPIEMENLIEMENSNVQMRMKKYCGKEVTLSIIDEDKTFKIQEDLIGFWWDFDCIEYIIGDEQEDIPQKETNKKYDYTTPKKVKALWLGQTDGDVEYKDAYYLYAYNKYIGIENGKKRFSLYYENGQEIGIIGTNCCDLSDSDNYYIFETARDLYLWMAEGEE